METKIKSGKGRRVAPNIHRVTVQMYNPPRKGVTTGKGSKDFKTTHTFNNIKTSEEALDVINRFAESRIGGNLSYSLIKKVYYNSEILVLDGQWVSN